MIIVNGNRPQASWLLLVLFLFALLLGLSGCGGGGDHNPALSSTAPIITFFTPVSGNVGRVVTITGANLSGATSVTFNGIPATAITTNTATSLQATVPSGNTTGNISITTPGGTVTSMGAFTFSTSLAQAGTPGINPVDGASMVWVPRGAFTMGSAIAVGNEDENPAHNVTVSGFWLYTYVVTVAQYRAFCLATGHALPPCPTDFSWTNTSGWNDPSLQAHPIINVSWDDAQAYAVWAGVQLPTEAQYEYAARGMYAYQYPWGGNANTAQFYNGWDQQKCANIYNSQNANRSTWPVGWFTAGKSWCGASGLSGNVWEWCADWYGPYSATGVTDPTGPASGDYRVIRGGSWGSDQNDTRSACRNSVEPTATAGDIGFRCISHAPAP